jgi:L-lactate dehydrogenase
MAGPKLKTSIAIVGCGDVGATLAYTLILQPICSEVILVDPKKELLEAQVRDLGDATYRGGSGVKVRAGDHKDAGQADIVVITAGAKQKTGLCYSRSRVTRKVGYKPQIEGRCEAVRFYSCPI